MWQHSPIFFNNSEHEQVGGQVGRKDGCNNCHLIHLVFHFLSQILLISLNPVIAFCHLGAPTCKSSFDNINSLVYVCEFWTHIRSFHFSLKWWKCTFSIADCKALMRQTAAAERAMCRVHQTVWSSDTYTPYFSFQQDPDTHSHRNQTHKHHRMDSTRSQNLQHTFSHCSCECSFNITASCMTERSFELCLSQCRVWLYVKTNNFNVACQRKHEETVTLEIERVRCLT